MGRYPLKPPCPLRQASCCNKTMTSIHIINLFFSSVLHTPMRSYYAFREFNKKGIITITALAIIAISVVTYVGALFNIFQGGFSLGRFAVQTGGIREKIMVIELELQKKNGDFMDIKSEDLFGMEKISTIRYIGLESSTAFLSQ